MAAVTESIELVAARVRTGGPRLGRTRLVVVDGPAGAGKTTYAGTLARELGDAQVVHMDDLYEGWDGLGPGVYQRLGDWLLGPLAAGRPGGYRRYDWCAAQFAEWHEVAPGAVLVLEGVGAAGLPVDGWATLRVWVQAPAPLRLARGLARDGAGLRDRWLRWAQDEQAHFAADRTRERAEVIVDGTG
ncbi:MAG: hypothetical protein QOI54_3604 [Actinomycetota bacterium]|nr:hypothetical protein [Actinomycetota bacterium]